ncbi:diguanylate cyclase [Chloroflexota bacterium]
MINYQKLYDFTSKIHSVFGLQEQAKELITLITKTIGCEHACLLFQDTGGEDYTILFCEPRSEDSPSSKLRLSGQNPIVEYLQQEQKFLTRDSLATHSNFGSLREENTGEIRLDNMELFMPLISSDRLIGILVLGKKQSGKYSLEDFSLLENITDWAAISMEKEYLREQLSEREEELSMINRSSVIMMSSLDVQEIFDNFVEELRKIVDINWAAIALIEDSDLYILALSSNIDSDWKVGERLPVNGTPTEWVVSHKETIVESDLSQRSQFAIAESYLKQGMRSIMCLPLVAKGKAIGSLTVASRHSNAYSHSHMIFLEQLASQIAMPVQHSRLYAETERKARIDGLTGLFNRQSLDEVIISEINRHARYGDVFSLIILDLDSLKAFNDNYGHLAGDELLKQTGSIIKKVIRNSDQAFRYGGDEFAILLPNTLIDAAYQAAERVRKQTASKVLNGYIPTTISLGLASWPANGTGADELIAAADAALYEAKRSGGNSSHCAS